MNELVLSVIVPVYNTAPWLRRCLDSICAQSYRNLEILCVNDGSTDNSAEILAEYAARDERIRVFTQVNAGLSAARNTALEHATGEWVTGVDSDDYLAPDAYARAVACVSPGVDMVFFGVQDVAEDGTPLPHNAYFDLPEAGEYAMTPELASRLNGCFWSKLWSRSLLEQHKLRFPHGLVHEDEALYFLAAPYTRKITVCHEMGYYYVQRSGSIMNEEGLDPVRRPARFIPVMKHSCEEYARRLLLDDEKRAYLEKMLARGAQALYWVGEEGAAVRTAYFELLQKYRLSFSDYRLERLLPVPRWQRLFLSRYPQSKVYRLFGVAFWVKQYDEFGMQVSSNYMVPGLLRRFKGWFAGVVVVCILLNY